MKSIKLITFSLLILLFNNCKDDKIVEKKEENLNVFDKNDIIKIKDFLVRLGSTNQDDENKKAIDSKIWFWEIYFDTKDTITKTSAVYTRNLTSPYLSSHPSQIYGQQLKLETFSFIKKDSTETKNYRNSLFSLDSINLKTLPSLAARALKIHKRNYYSQKNDTVVGLKIYKPNFSFVSKINIMVQIGNPSENHFRHPPNNLSDKLYYSNYEFNHKGKLLFSEHKGRNRVNYSE